MWIIIKFHRVYFGCSTVYWIWQSYINWSLTRRVRNNVCVTKLIFLIPSSSSSAVAGFTLIPYAVIPYRYLSVIKTGTRPSLLKWISDLVSMQQIRSLIVARWFDTHYALIIVTSAKITLNILIYEYLILRRVDSSLMTKIRQKYP